MSQPFQPDAELNPEWSGWKAENLQKRPGRSRRQADLSPALEPPERRLRAQEHGFFIVPQTANRNERDSFMTPMTTKPMTLVLVALLWSAAAEQTLAATFTTLDYPGSLSTIAIGIDGNNTVGIYTTPTIHGFLYNGTTYTTLDHPLAGTNGTVARGISGGNIVGLYSDSSLVKHGFLYNGATYTTFDDPLATQGTLAFAIDGNNIVGMYVNSSGTHGFLYNGTTYTTLDVPLVGASEPVPTASPATTLSVNMTTPRGPTASFSTAQPTRHWISPAASQPLPMASTAKTLSCRLCRCKGSRGFPTRRYISRCCCRRCRWHWFQTLPQEERQES